MTLIEVPQHITAASAILMESAAVRLEPIKTFDPVQFEYVRSLCDRAARQSPALQNLLNSRIEKAEREYRQRYEQAQSSSKTTRAQSAYTDALKSLSQLSARLTSHMRPDSSPGEGNATAGELKALQLLRQQRAERALQKRVAQLMKAEPDNAGPLNSQALVVRTMQVLNRLSPEYLSRFVTYSDALLWLESANTKTPLIAEKVVPRKRGKGTAQT